MRERCRPRLDRGRYARSSWTTWKTGHREAEVGPRMERGQDRELETLISGWTGARCLLREGGVRVCCKRRSSSGI